MLGCDSIKLETVWRSYYYEHSSDEQIKRVPIRGGMYEVRLDVWKINVSLF